MDQPWAILAKIAQDEVTHRCEKALSELTARLQQLEAEKSKTVLERLQDIIDSLPKVEKVDKVKLLKEVG